MNQSELQALKEVLQTCEDNTNKQVLVKYLEKTEKPKDRAPDTIYFQNL